MRIRSLLVTEEQLADVLHSLFGIEIQIRFILRNEELAGILLPEGWEITHQAREMAAGAASRFSPTIARDCEILRMLS